MSMYPVDKQPTNRVLDVRRAYQSVMQPLRLEENALLAATVQDLDLEETRSRLEAGSRVDVTNARLAVEQRNNENQKTLVDTAFAANEDPGTSARLIANEDQKRDLWNSSGDNLYLELALSLDDPTIDADISRFLTNMQIGEETLSAAVEASGDETGVGGYIWDFVDRYFLRAVVIGGFEDITNRSERGGREHLLAAMTMNPDEYSRWISARVEEVKQEGFFTGDNFFAIGEELGRMQNAGQDPYENLWRALGVLDVAPLAGLLGKAVKAGTLTRRAKAIAGPLAADDTYEAILKAEGDTPKPRDVNDGMPEALNPISDPDGAASLSRTERIRTENSIIGDMDHLNEVGATGRGINSDEVVRASQAMVETLRKTVNNPLVNVHRPIRRDATGNFIWNVKLGTVKTGRPYVDDAAAERAIRRSGLRDEFPTARAVPYDETRPELGSYIEIDHRLNVDPYVDEVGWKGALNEVSTAIARFAGSQAATENKGLSVLANIAEALSGTLMSGRAATQLVNTVNKVDADSQTALSKIFNNLRDGKDAGMRDHYDEVTFRSKFEQFHPTNKPATQRDVDAYNAIVELSDASYMQRAHLRLQRYVRSNYQAVVLPDGTRVPGKKFEGTTGEHIYDFRDRTPRYQRDLRKNTTVWELDRPLEGGIRYVVNPSDIRILDHADVLPYNAGGRRLNPKANHLVVLMGNTPRAFMTTVTRQQAELTIEQIGNIQRAIDEVGGPEAVKKGGPIDEVIRNNNDWNPVIVTGKQ